MLSIPFPHIDPYIVRFGELGVTWYSLSYMFGIVVGWQFCIYIANKFKLPITTKQIDDLLTWVIIGVIVGGRLGEVIFYDPVYYIDNPAEIFKTYKGGMSFHGGLVGVLIAIYSFCKKNKLEFFLIADMLAICTPLCIMLGRVANFINGELYGEITTMKWGVIFPGAGTSPRHPSQLYESLTEGMFLYVLLLYLALRTNSLSRRGLLAGIFLIVYAIARFLCEFFRVPDFEAFGLSSGQLYSLPMLVFGLYFIKRAYGIKTTNHKNN